jgi:predicted regulator of Ras-like GTPase activity (Roadblock/LC7/MglB family)
VKNDTVNRLAERLKEPVRAFVQDSRVRIALLVNQVGQVLAQHGFTGGYQVVDVAALAAAANASARALAGLTGAERWTHLHHAGKERHLFLAPFDTPAGELILVAIFDQDSSLGLVQHFFERLAREVAALPELQAPQPLTDAATFERELEAGLQDILYRAVASED